ncbi:UNVERIFIED_CONTAM: hypothetical protein NCL1_63952, partial [Trichonephila clavipes]
MTKPRWCAASRPVTKHHCWRCSHARVRDSGLPGHHGPGTGVDPGPVDQGAGHARSHPGAGHPVHQRHRPAGAVRHLAGLGPVFRSGAADRGDGLHRHRGSGQ